jgi:hypothetical protein
MFYSAYVRQTIYRAGSTGWRGWSVNDGGAVGDRYSMPGWAQSLLVRCFRLYWVH